MKKQLARKPFDVTPPPSPAACAATCQPRRAWSPTLAQSGSRRRRRRMSAAICGAAICFGAAALLSIFAARRGRLDVLDDVLWGGDDRGDNLLNLFTGDRVEIEIEA